MSVHLKLVLARPTPRFLPVKDSSSYRSIMTDSNSFEAVVIDVAGSLGDQQLVTAQWEHTISVAPDMVVLIGEAITMSAVPSASRVRFAKRDLEYVTQRCLCQSELAIDCLQKVQSGG